MEGTPAGIVDVLGLEPLPREGGLFAQTLADEHSTAIYYLLERPAVSALHRLTSTEVFHFYAGSPARMLLLRATVRLTSRSSAIASPSASDRR
jgi:predicted cupin superfamily sugar epimerase